MSQPFEDEQQVDATVRACLRDVLGLDAARVAGFDESTRLFGAMPEFDSMATAGFLAEIEERLAIRVDEIDGEALATFGSLMAFILPRTLR
jgi:acyl carrier protein